MFLRESKKIEPVDSNASEAAGIDETPVLTAFQQISAPVKYAYVTDSVSLMKILGDNRIPKDVRMMSALFSLFPYLKTNAKDHITLLNYYGTEMY